MKTTAHYQPENYFALIVGIDHYQSFDESLNWMPGTTNLSGSINDTRIFYRLARAMGVPPENITVITSASVESETYAEDAARQKFFHGATRQQILEQFEILAENLKSDPERRVGFFAFSGHGDCHAQTQALQICPSDVRVRDVNESEYPIENILELSELEQIIGDTNVNLTYLLDCCFTLNAYAPNASPVEVRAAQLWRVGLFGEEGIPEVTLTNPESLVLPVRSLTRRTMPGVPGLAMPTYKDPVILGCEVGSCSYEAEFEGVVHGAFTRMIGLVLDRWNHALTDASEGAYHILIPSLIQKTRGILQALSIPQTPTVLGPAGPSSRRVFHRETSTLNTDGDPRALKSHEVYSGTAGGCGFFEIRNANNVVVGHAVSPGKYNYEQTFQSKNGGAPLTRNFTAQNIYFYTVNPFTLSSFSIHICESSDIYAEDVATLKLHMTDTDFSGDSADQNGTQTNYKINKSGALIGYVQRVQGSYTWYMKDSSGQNFPVFTLPITITSGNFTIGNGLFWKVVDTVYSES